MDIEKLQKKQSLKVIISEAIMVLAVVILVSILALVVSGYWLNSDFKVERNGMLQISSVPTGADVNIDGETSSWLQRTNTSKVLASGEHTVTLSKNHYDSWSKTINVSEGLLYRLHYPRLFLQDREPETALSATGATFATISPKNDKLLLVGDTTDWKIVNLNNDTLEPKKLSVASYLPGVTLSDGATVGVFNGKIRQADWDRSGAHILMQVETDSATEWVLIDVENPKNSLSLTKEFGVDFSDVEILDNSSSNLLAVQNHNLRKIDVPGKAISAVLVEDVADFDHYENEIVFSAKAKAANSVAEIDAKSEAQVAAETGQYLVGLTEIGSDEITELEFTTEPAKVTISKFYDDMYISTLQGNNFSLYKKVDFEPVNNFELSFTPAEVKVGHNGEFITLSDGIKLATLDMEASAIREWSPEGGSFGWLDNDMIYSVASGELLVYDFDGLNRRALAKNVSSHFPATITDNKWLYYFSDNNLIREKIVE